MHATVLSLNNHDYRRRRRRCLQPSNPPPNKRKKQDTYYNSKYQSPSLSSLRIRQSSPFF